jgi:hypothetical protein
MMATNTTKVTVQKSKAVVAFIEAQSEFPDIPKDSEGGGGSFTYKYASLPAILKACNPVLHKHKLAISQSFDNGDIVTSLIHESGDEMQSRMACSADGLKPQDFGAKITYYRRYAIVAMLGIAPDDDTDAAGVDAPEPAPLPVPAPANAETQKYLAAVNALVARGVAALTALGNWEDPAAEMERRKANVLGHEGYEHETEITAKPARVEFYHALEETVKAIEKVFVSPRLGIGGKLDLLALK